MEMDNQSLGVNNKSPGMNNETVDMNHGNRVMNNEARPAKRTAENGTDPREEIRNLLKTRILESSRKKGLFLHRESIDESFDLYESGVLDSFDLYEFLLSLEDDLAVKLDLSSLTPRSFTVFGTLVEILVEHKEKSES